MMCRVGMIMMVATGSAMFMVASIVVFMGVKVQSILWVVRINMLMMVMLAMIMLMVMIVIMRAFTMSWPMHMPISWMQNFHLNQVEDQTQDWDREHKPTFNFRFGFESLDGLKYQEYRDDPNAEDWQQGTKHLCTVVAPAELVVSVALCNYKSHCRKAYPNNIGKKVCGIRHNCDWVGEIPSDYLDGHEDEGQQDHKQELAECLLILFQGFVSTLFPGREAFGFMFWTVVMMVVM